MSINIRAHRKNHAMTAHHRCQVHKDHQVHKDPIHNYTDFPWHAFDALTLMHNLYNHTQLRKRDETKKDKTLVHNLPANSMRNNNKITILRHNN